MYRFDEYLIDKINLRYKLGVALHLSTLLSLVFPFINMGFIGLPIITILFGNPLLLFYWMLSRDYCQRSKIYLNVNPDNATYRYYLVSNNEFTSLRIYAHRYFFKTLVHEIKFDNMEDALKYKIECDDYVNSHKTIMEI